MEAEREDRSKYAESGGCHSSSGAEGNDPEDIAAKSDVEERAEPGDGSVAAVSKSQERKRGALGLQRTEDSDSGSDFALDFSGRSSSADASNVEEAGEKAANEAAVSSKRSRVLSSSSDGE